MKTETITAAIANRLRAEGREIVLMEAQAEIQLSTGGTLLVPGPLPIGSMHETQWGFRKVIANRPEYWADITPDCPTNC
jgi:hypothetical protein